MKILGVFDDVNSLEAAPIEDLAYLVLERARLRLNAATESFQAGNLEGDLGDESSQTSSDPSFPLNRRSPADQIRIKRIILEAMAWLLSERLVAEDHKSAGNFIISRLGQAVKTNRDLASYGKSAYLPHGVLRDDVSEIARHLFLTGHYDEAVFAAFKRLEVRIRDAAGYPSDSLGVSMVRNAFHATHPGPLTDPDQIIAERQATSDIFAGAIGYYKNPLSHRELELDDAAVAASRILLANELMNVLDVHVGKRNSKHDNTLIGSGHDK